MLPISARRALGSHSTSRRTTLPQPRSGSSKRAPDPARALGLSVNSWLQGRVLLSAAASLENLAQALARRFSDRQLADALAGRVRSPSRRRGRLVAQPEGGALSEQRALSLQ